MTKVLALAEYQDCASPTVQVVAMVVFVVQQPNPKLVDAIKLSAT